MLPLPRYLLDRLPIRPCWFVGAAFGGKDDQSERFIKEKIWETNKDEAKKQIQDAQPGDRIAIKATYVRKNDVPLDSNGEPVSVMSIKATGTVLVNHGNGRLEVDWTPCDPVREWYFCTNLKTVWKVFPGIWTADALIAFAFEGKKQDIELFRNTPSWAYKYGDRKLYGWIQFYMAVADKLLTYRNRREELFRGMFSILKGKRAEDSWEYLMDICPFTVMALFNRSIDDKKRTRLAREIADFLGVSEAVPTLSRAISVVDDEERSWFFDYADKRASEKIDALWEVFARAIAYADARYEGEEDRIVFCEAYDAAIRMSGVKWNLSIGLYWARPWFYSPLDAWTRRYISDVCKLQIGKEGCDADDYISLAGELWNKFGIYEFPVKSIPMLVFEASAIPPYPTYTTQTIVDEGCFVPKSELDTMLERLREKKNLILQGPPGTGKTWLAKKLAYALTGARDEARIRAVQFHPSLSYEDFVRGWRPAGNGQLTLTDGPLMEMVQLAHGDPEHPHIVLIEEINRGNPAQILGEMLTLLEADKRNPESALTLLYRKEQDERIYLPPNLYVIGTMNIADRSLALVDLALRRRFALVSLFPRIDDTWQRWVHDTCGMPMEILKVIRQNMQALNESIASDRQLGPQFQVGHSYVTPSQGTTIADPVQWFINVVETEIFPLLEEYWYENPKKAEEARNLLLRGF